MRILVFGGSVFLSRAVATEALRRGHQVVCACRGTSGPVPDGADLVVIDRADPLPEAITDPAAGADFDAVVDVGRQPSWIRRAVSALPDAHWIFVSSISAYSDDSDPHSPVHEPRHDDTDLSVEPDAYGPMKVACEQVVREGTRSSLVLRPGLIVGPGDPTGRFTYWADRLADTDRWPEVLAPGDPDDLVQVIDVRDLATWIVESAESGRSGVHDAVGPVQRIDDLLNAAATGAGVTPTWTWVDHEFLAGHDVEPWSGDRSVPLWLPRPEYDGMLAHDADPAVSAGLRTRSVARTTHDTIEWLRATPAAPRTGLTRVEEHEILDLWSRLS